MPRAFFTRSADFIFSGLLLCGGLLAATWPAGLAWSLSPDRERGGYGSYDDPVERPTLPMPGQRMIDTIPPGQQSGASSQSNEAELARAERLVGSVIVGSDGARLGDVRAIVRSKKNHSLQALVAIGGSLGLGNKHVVVPVDQLVAQPGSENGLLVLASGNDRDLLDMAAYRPDQFELVPAASAVPRG